MERRRSTCDVVVVGSGAAGLRAAIAAAEKGMKVLVVSKGAPGLGTSTVMSLGVLAGASGEGNPEMHREQTLRAGRGINDLRLVEVLVEEGPRRLEELVRWGARVAVRGGFLFALGRPPTWGKEIVRCLLERARALGVEFLSGLVVGGILTEKGRGAILGFFTASRQWLAIGYKGLVLATGGGGALYERHDNPQAMMGEGYALALDVGATLQDMEFVQFFPLGLAEPGLPPLLVPPRLADRGRLVNGRGEELLEKYGIVERPAAASARDRLSQVLFHELHHLKETVWLDLRETKPEEWLLEGGSRFMLETLGERYGARDRPVRVAPMAHHLMGGVSIGTHGETDVPGFFAAGESAGGLHGANRMGGNALTETLVFGALAGEAAASWATGSRDEIGGQLAERIRSLVCTSRAGDPGRKVSDLKRELRRLLWGYVGVARTRHEIIRAIEGLEEIRKEASTLPWGGSPRTVQRTLEVQLGVRTALVISRAALRREESRGAHFREDFPSQDDARWRGHLTLRLAQGGREAWEFVPMEEKTTDGPDRDPGT